MQLIYPAHSSFQFPIMAPIQVGKDSVLVLQVAIGTLWLITIQCNLTGVAKAKGKNTFSWSCDKGLTERLLLATDTGKTGVALTQLLIKTLKYKAEVLPLRLANLVAIPAIPRHFFAVFRDDVNASLLFLRQIAQLHLDPTVNQY